MWDAAVEARRHADEVAVACRELVCAAKADAERVRAAAAEAGRQEGLASATELLVRAARARDEALASAERDVVDLAFTVAARVLAREFQRDRAAVVEIAARAVAEARRRTDIALRVHPDDVGAVRAAEPHLAEGLLRARGLRVVGDPAVARGGAVVETEAGSVDARIATQLEALRRTLDPRP